MLEEDGRPYRNRGWWFPRALLPDFTLPEARAWWTEKRRYLVEEMGVDGFKTDGGEHTWGDELRFGDGTRGIHTNNRYPNLYAMAFHELMRSAGVEPMTFSRAGHAGAGSFPGHWAGDERSTWEAYRASVTAGLSAGASGVFMWSWDHGGFSGELPTAELYLRTGAMAVFSPIMQYHAEFNAHRVPSRDRTPWNVAEQTGDPSVLSIYRELSSLRERLVPYLVAQATASVERSTPLMRALFVDWPRDPRIWEFPLQYLLGDDLLVSPVTEEGATGGRPTCRTATGSTSGPASRLPVAWSCSGTCRSRSFRCTAAPLPGTGCGRSSSASYFARTLLLRASWVSSTRPSSSSRGGMYMPKRPR